MQVAGRAGPGDLDEEANEACEDIDTIPIQVIVERTFMQFPQIDISQQSDV